MAKSDDEWFESQANKHRERHEWEMQSNLMSRWSRESYHSSVMECTCIGKETRLISQAVGGREPEPIVLAYHMRCLWVCVTTVTASSSFPKLYPFNRHTESGVGGTRDHLWLLLLRSRLQLISAPVAFTQLEVLGHDLVF